VFAVRRLGAIVLPESHPDLGANIQGPAVIRVPVWIENRLGDYYLYFADHKGNYIRLAYANDPAGPWTVHPPCSLHLRDSHFPATPLSVTAEQLKALESRWRRAGTVLSHDALAEATTPHIASPDVHVDAEHRRIVMYFHGLDAPGSQVTRVATSLDGIAFDALPEIVVDRSYLRVFRHRGTTYGLAMPGQMYRSSDGFARFESGPMLFNPNMRHAATLVRGDTLFVFWTEVGYAPERILLSRVDLSGDWRGWTETAPIELMRPEYDWEGADAPIIPSIRSTAYGHVNQLRDPAILEDSGRLFLFYAVAGEAGIAVAALSGPDV
jgi:hypothetical protein